MKELNEKEHIKRHKELHQGLDEIVADFITHTDHDLFNTPVMELIKWSHQQTTNPTVEK